MRRLNGFTLIEVMVTVAIVAILAAIALPVYSRYVMRSHLTEGVAGLSSLRVKMEQYFQDNRTYVGACTSNSIAPLPLDTAYFQIRCPTRTATQFTATATGQGTLTGMVYQLDETNAHTTTSVPSGWLGAGSTCWVLKDDGSC